MPHWLWPALALPVLLLGRVSARAAARKSSQALRFFTSSSPAERRDFLRSSGVDYVLVTNPDFVRSLEPDPNLVLLGRADGGALFKVTP